MFRYFIFSPEVFHSSLKGDYLYGIVDSISKFGISVNGNEVPKEKMTTRNSYFKMAAILKKYSISSPVKIKDSKDLNSYCSEIKRNGKNDLIFVREHKLDNDGFEEICLTKSEFNVDILPRLRPKIGFKYSDYPSQELLDNLFEKLFSRVLKESDKIELKDSMLLKGFKPYKNNAFSYGLSKLVSHYSKCRNSIDKNGEISIETQYVSFRGSKGIMDEDLLNKQRNLLENFLIELQDKYNNIRIKYISTERTSHQRIWAFDNKYFVFVDFGLSNFVFSPYNQTKSFRLLLGNSDDVYDIDKKFEYLPNLFNDNFK